MTERLDEWALKMIAGRRPGDTDLPKRLAQAIEDETIVYRAQAQAQREEIAQAIADHALKRDREMAFEVADMIRAIEP